MKNTNNVPSVEEVEVVETPVEEAPEAPKKASKKASKKATVEPDRAGIVANCKMLNIRAEPNKQATVVAIVASGAELKVDANEVDGWYSVCMANGVRGFCMKDYVTILQ